jgi:hypothetical protein
MASVLIVKHEKNDLAIAKDRQLMGLLDQAASTSSKGDTLLSFILNFTDLDLFTTHSCSNDEGCGMKWRGIKQGKKKENQRVPFP